MRTDTEATVELWQEQAIHNLQAAEDFKLELADARREMRKLERERDEARERVKDIIHENETLYRRLESVHEVYRLSSADRLAEAANVVIDQWETPNWKLTEPTATYMNTLRNTLTAWKEARSECR